MLCGSALITLQAVQKVHKAAARQRLKATYTVLSAQICPSVIELLECIQILADDGCMQVCGKLPFLLQAI